MEETVQEFSTIDYTSQLDLIIENLILINQSCDILKGFIAVILGILITFSLFSFTFMRK